MKIFHWGGCNNLTKALDCSHLLELKKQVENTINPHIIGTIYAIITGILWGALIFGSLIYL